jgi:4-hydroxyphenylpyruvate dioxygenase
LNTRRDGVTIGPMTTGTTAPAGPSLELPADHPGVSDPRYRDRRAAIAGVGAAFRSGDPIPDVEYTPDEDEVWRTVSSELAAKHDRLACDAYREAAAALTLPADRVPQLREVDERVRALTGFRIEPVPGLVPTRTFYGALAERRFLSTQYIRHHSVPFYTPEPDIVHEIIGHANQLASPTFADLYESAGRASVRASTPDALELFSRVWWFTLEFGVAWEHGELRAYGAGLLSSYGEIDAFRRAELRPWDLAAMSAQAYDITTYQPVLFAAPSFEQAVDELSTFFDAYDDDAYHRLVGRRMRGGPTMTATSPTTTTATVDERSSRNHLGGWDCIELWVGNARTMAGFLMSAFGFDCTGYAGPETGRPDRVSYVLEQGDIRLVVTGALESSSPIAAHVRAHGDGVHDLAWIVDDAAAAFSRAVDRGARSVRVPWSESDELGTLWLAQIATFGETVHTFVERRRYDGPRLEPGFSADDLPPAPPGPPVGLRAIDHVVGNVEQGQLDRWVHFYAEVLGFDQLVHFDDDQISTEYSALMSTVVWDGTTIVMPLNEPAEGRRKSQIQEYVETYDGPGVQHIALRTDDVVATVEALRTRGVRFMDVPDDYYDEAERRMAGVDLPWDDLRRLRILVDRDADGHLLQIFTETVTDRPTVFFEIIQRGGSRGFGEGNFKALFEAIERAQARRGHL